MSTHRVFLILMLAHGALCVVFALSVVWVLYDDAQSLACCANDHLHLFIVFACLMVVAIAEGWIAVFRFRSPADTTPGHRFFGWTVLAASIVLVAATVLGNLSSLFVLVALAAILFATADLRFFSQAAS